MQIGLAARCNGWPWPLSSASNKWGQPQASAALFDRQNCPRTNPRAHRHDPVCGGARQGLPAKTGTHVQTEAGTDLNAVDRPIGVAGTADCRAHRPRLRLGSVCGAYRRSGCITVGVERRRHYARAMLPKAAAAVEPDRRMRPECFSAHHPNRSARARFAHQHAYLTTSSPDCAAATLSRTAD